jgi:hypothetical protein
LVPSSSCWRSVLMWLWRHCQSERVVTRPDPDCCSGYHEKGSGSVLMACS